jgi:hypothetical protein
VSFQDSGLIPAAPTPQLLGSALYRAFSRSFSAAFFDRNATDLRAGQARTSERFFQETFIAYRDEHGGIPKGLSKKDFELFSSRALRRIHNELSLRAEDLRELPVLSAAIKDALEVHYRLLLLAGMPESMAGRRGHMFSAHFVDDLMQRSKKVFKSPSLERVRKTAVNQVLMGRYPSLSAASRRYRALLLQARTLAADESNLEPLTRTAATLVFCGNFKTMKAFKTCYERNYTRCLRTFGSDTDTASIVRSAALLVTMRGGETPAEAKKRLDYLTNESTARYPKAQGKSELLRTARLMVFLKKYPNFDVFDARYESVKKSVSRALRTRPRLQELESTIINEVMAFKYPSGSLAVKFLTRLDATAKKRFQNDPLLGPVAPQGVVSVFRREFRDLNHWERVQRRGGGPLLRESLKKSTL